MKYMLWRARARAVPGHRRNEMAAKSRPALKRICLLMLSSIALVLGGCALRSAEDILKDAAPPQVLEMQIRESRVGIDCLFASLTLPREPEVRSKLLDGIVTYVRLGQSDPEFVPWQSTPVDEIFVSSDSRVSDPFASGILCDGGPGSESMSELNAFMGVSGGIVTINRRNTATIVAFPSIDRVFVFLSD